MISPLHAGCNGFRKMQAKSESFRSLVSVPLTTMIGISLVSERAADTEPILDEIFLSLTRPYGVDPSGMIRESSFSTEGRSRA